MDVDVNVDVDVGMDVGVGVCAGLGVCLSVQNIIQLQCVRPLWDAGFLFPQPTNTQVIPCK
jgi:hypothetical protein